MLPKDLMEASRSLPPRERLSAIAKTYDLIAGDLTEHATSSSNNALATVFLAQMVLELTVIVKDLLPMVS